VLNYLNDPANEIRLGTVQEIGGYCWEQGEGLDIQGGAAGRGKFA